MSGVFVGMPAFPAAAAGAVADPVLRANLRHATHTIRDKRAAAVAELADWAQLRAAGAAIKDRTLRHLDRYLLQAEAAVTAAGGTVHWAADAAEANRIVTDLVRATGHDEVVKVKSMATQEIGLNEHLAAAGIRAYETDLAELIVQLGRDTPSHILVPAIHKNRSEIRDIFASQMAAWGRPAPDGLTDEPAELAEAARLHLREKFLTAKVAVSGGNFLVAETGTVVVVESEGNGRMCLTLPDTLISVVGIEKIVPTWRDLEVFLQLLPRSSTAERMNPYTSMWTGTTDGDGPSAFHLVLLDNGRTGVLDDDIGAQALRCIRCSACLNICPVYERAGGHAYGSVYPGPIGAILTPQLRGTASALDASLPYASTLCGACFDVCPVAIDIPRILVHLRERTTGTTVAGGRGTGTDAGTKDGRVAGTAAVTVAPAKRRTAERLAMRAARRTFQHPALLAAVQRTASRTRRFQPRTLPGPGARQWTADRDLPPMPDQPFRDWWRTHRADTPPGPRGALAPGTPAAGSGAPSGKDETS